MSLGPFVAAFAIALAAFFEPRVEAGRLAFWLLVVGLPVLLVIGGVGYAMYGWLNR